MARPGSVALLVLVMASLLSGCAKEAPPPSRGTSSPPATEAPLPNNLVSLDAAREATTIACAPEGSTERTITIGHLELHLPEWWDDVQPLLPVPSRELSRQKVLDYQKLGDAKKGTYRRSVKMWVEIGTRSPGAVATAWVGHSLVAGEEYAAAGCVWAASWHHNEFEPTEPEAAFNTAHSPFNAGRAYRLAGETALATEWLQLAATNPGGTDAGAYYAGEAEELLAG